MDSEKQGSSKTSSEETDQTESVAKRSYECTFCKRGFTNAQALGGHMNIHRKDRAKAKLSTRTSVSSEPKYYPVFENFFQARWANPSPMEYAISDHFLGARPEMSYRDGARGHDEILGTNLSLGIGPIEMETNDLIIKRYVKNIEDHEIDLELRLGHHP